MDSFFGIGLPELLLILLLAGLVMGPERIRSTARYLGRQVANIQGIARNFTRLLNAELDGVEMQELRDTANDLRALKQQVEEMRHELISLPRDLSKETRTTLNAKPTTDKSPSPNLADDDDSTPSIAPPRLPQAMTVPDDPDA